MTKWAVGNNLYDPQNKSIFVLILDLQGKWNEVFFWPVLQAVEQFVTTDLLTITFGLSTYNFNFGKTYKFIFPRKFTKNHFS